jgi:2,3-bisphosphoglycerate-independent phosphoglycerate mutase
MKIENLLPELITENENKILLLVLDGVGGLPDPVTAKTELETAHIPVIDEFARKGSCGLATPVFNGITPGSGPGHIALFGYDPVEVQIGRGVLECLGIGINLQKEDIAIRGNFAAVDDKGVVTDRRAGRIPTEENKKLIAVLSEQIKEIKGVKINLQTVKEHRCTVVLKGKKLNPSVTENDPQVEGAELKELTPLEKNASFTAEVLNEFENKARDILKKTGSRATGILLRGISQLPDIPTFEEKYKLKAACIATYPMYKGVSKVAGMDIIEAGSTIQEEVTALQQVYDKYNFFFLHIKKTDSMGEDGNFAGKVKILEEASSKLWPLKNMKFGAMAITGDHSTPAKLKSHSWHPLPVTIVSENTIPDDVSRFTERDCAKGILGHFFSKELMYLLLANSLKLKKFGA